MAEDAAALLGSLGLEVMSESPFEVEQLSCYSEDNSDTNSVSSSDTASARSGYHFASEE